MRKFCTLPSGTSCQCDPEYSTCKELIQKSIGHIMFYGEHEYLYIGGNNSIYKVPIANPFEKTQYGNIRTGARFESTFNGWKNHPLNPERKEPGKVIVAS